MSKTELKIKFMKRKKKKTEKHNRITQIKIN